MWKTLGALHEQAGLGAVPRRVVEEPGEIGSSDHGKWKWSANALGPTPEKRGLRRELGKPG